MSARNETHDPSLASWVEWANAPGIDFPEPPGPFIAKNFAMTSIEPTVGGKQPVQLPDGESRTVVEDGAVLLRGWCERPDAVRLRFGEVRGTLLPSLA